MGHTQLSIDLKGCDTGNTTGQEGSFRVSLWWESLYQYKCHSRPCRRQLRCKKTRPTLGEYRNVPVLVASCSVRDNISCNNSIGLASRDKDPAHLQWSLQVEKSTVWHPRQVFTQFMYKSSPSRYKLPTRHHFNPKQYVTWQQKLSFCFQIRFHRNLKQEVGSKCWSSRCRGF